MSLSSASKNILYEIICCSEWVASDQKDEPSRFSFPKVRNQANGLLDCSRFFQNKASRLNTSQISRRLLSCGPIWLLAPSPDGSLLAILQTSTLEIRSSRDSFGSVVGKNSVRKDDYPHLRKMCWSDDSNLLGVSFTDGSIVFYDHYASQLFSVLRCSLPSQEDVASSRFLKNNALAGLFFIPSRITGSSCIRELISVDTKGKLNCFRQTNVDQMVFHHESIVLKKYYPKGIFSAIYCPSHDLMLVSGAFNGGAHSKTQDVNCDFGITAWRILNDDPYYRIIFDTTNSAAKVDNHSLWPSIPSILSNKPFQNGIFKLVMSPDTKFVAAIHASGAVSVWHIPSLKLHRYWTLKQQFQNGAENARFNNHWLKAYNKFCKDPIDPWRFHIFDLSWWDEKTVIISRVNGSVALWSISEEALTANLLGNSPEFFESSVRITNRHNKGFYALECEIRCFKAKSRRGSTNMPVDENNVSSPSPKVLLEDGFDFDETDSQSWVKNLVKELLFWLTDSEKFRPARKKKKKLPYWTETHRLFSLRSITPMELYNQKIEAEEYGVALDLARAYGLDTDLVYQRKWSRNPVTTHSIKDFLGKIKKRNWVLQECLERVPEGITAAQQLLTFGLKGTDLSAALMITQGKDDGRFIMWTPDDIDISQEDYVLLIDFQNVEVKRLMSYRKKFLFYLHILNTYELMLGGPATAEELFDASAYEKLRSRSPLESCVEMARNEDFDSLRLMLTHHWDQVEGSYLEILSNLPETTSPYTYKDFLPLLKRENEICLWEQTEAPEPDWCDSYIGTEDGSGDKGKLSVQDIVAWYDKKMRDIESLSGIISHAYQLGLLGLQNNVPDIQDTVENLKNLEVLVYDVGVDDLSLDVLEQMSYLERLELLLSKATPETYITHFKEFALPFLEECNNREKGSRLHLLNQYLPALAAHDLNAVLPVFEASKPGKGSTCIIQEIGELIQLAVTCIYANERPEDFPSILKILDCIPERDKLVKDDQLAHLHDTLDLLERHYEGSAICRKYDVHISLSRLQYLTTDSESEGVYKLVEKICLAARHRKEPLKLTEWKSLLYDLLELQKKVFVEFSKETCFEIYVNSLLKSGSTDVINLAREFLERSKPDEESEKSNFSSKASGLSEFVRRVAGSVSVYSTSYALYLHVIPYEKSLEMVLNAAQLYFDSANDFSDSDMKLARVVLNLIDNLKEPSIVYMFDLIDAIKIMNKDFQLNILPQTVRKTKDRWPLVQQSMDNINTGYKKYQQLLKLAVFLHIEHMELLETESLILGMVGNSALEAGDLTFCVSICHSIMAKEYETGWEVFSALAEIKHNVDLLDIDTKITFVNYALNICPDDQIFRVLNVRKFLLYGDQSE